MIFKLTFLLIGICIVTGCGFNLEFLYRSTLVLSRFYHFIVKGVDFLIFKTSENCRLAII